MNAIVSFLIEVAVTVIAASLIVAYFRPHLRRILVDLCGTEDRANFWTVFTNILLIGMPVVLSLNFKADAQTPEEIFFEIIGKLSGNLVGFLFALVCVGGIVSFFALFAPKPKAETK